MPLGALDRQTATVLTVAVVLVGIQRMKRARLAAMAAAEPAAAYQRQVRWIGKRDKSG